MSNSQAERGNYSVCFQDTVLKKDGLPTECYKTAVFYHPSVHSNSSTSSSAWDIEVKIRDLDLEDRPANYLRAREKQRHERKTAPLVYFRK